MDRSNAAIIVAVIAVSFSSIFIRWSDAHPLAIAFYRLAFTTIMLLPFVLLWGKEEIKGIDKKEGTKLFAIGFVLSIHFAFWITSLEMTTVASSVILVTSHPMFVAIISYYWLKEKISTLNAVGIVVAFTGVIILSAGDLGVGRNNFMGDMYALIGAFAAGAYIMSGRVMRKKLSVVTYAFLVYGICTIFLLIFSIALKVHLYPLPGREYLLFVLMALIPGIMGHTVYNWSLKYVKASVVSVSLLGEPIGASILALAILGEIPEYMAIVGGAIILAGIYLAASKKFGLGEKKKSETN